METNHGVINDQLRDKSNDLGFAPGKESNPPDIRKVWSVGTLILHADNENSVLTQWTVRLISVFAGSKSPIVGLVTQCLICSRTWPRRDIDYKHSQETVHGVISSRTWKIL